MVGIRAAADSRICAQQCATGTDGSFSSTSAQLCNCMSSGGKQVAILSALHAATLLRAAALHYVSSTKRGLSGSFT